MVGGMGLGLFRTGMLVAVCAWGVASAAETGGSSRMLGGARPMALSDLPSSVFRDRLSALPAPAQQRAMAWLESFEFPPEDVHDLAVDDEGGVYYTCEFPATDSLAASEPEAPVTPAASMPVGPFPPSLIFHSRPSSTNVIFLDFDGAVIVGTAWNASLGRTQIIALAYSTDTNTAEYSDAEQLAIKRIWQRVAEDFAPFDVNVTTEAPASFHNRVSHCLITRNTDAAGNPNPSSTAGGVAYVGIFGGANNSYSSPAWVYHNNLSNSEGNIAEAASHEIGHNLGLSHDGLTNGVSYYSGHGSGVTSWGPIMGTGYGRNVSQWSKGEYAGANNTQDDLQIIAAKLPYLADDVGDTLALSPFLTLTSNRFIRATTPETDPARISTENKGLITSTNDTDTWSFITGTGTVSLAVRPWIGPSGTRGGNLDVRIEILTTAGVVIASSNPDSETIASINTTLAAGQYYLRIQSSSFGNPTSATPTGFTRYGSIGQYFITGVVADASTVILAPAAELLAAPDVAAAGAPSYAFSVRYTDERAIDTASLGNDDLTVTGPAGFTAAASLIALDATTPGSPRTATYAFTPPGGMWDPDDNGGYTIALNPDSVYDDGGSAAPAGTLGAFNVAITPFVYQALMNTNPGWSLSGSWSYGKPNGNNGDPTLGASGTNVIGYNLSGRYARNLSASYATTPAFTCAFAETVTLRFQRWLGVANGDSATLQILTESNTWTTVWSSSGTLNDTSWQAMTYDLTPWAAGRTNVQLRWGQASNSDSTTQFGWNIDDVEITATFQPASLPLTSYARVDLAPAEAVNAGAAWRFTTAADTNWMEPDAVAGPLAAGTYTVTFKPLPGWITPADAEVTLAANATTLVAAAYTPLTTSAFGVPVWWLNRFGYTNELETAVNANGANGVPLWQSYIAGLDPTDPASRFEALPAPAANEQDLVIRWNPVSGRVYAIYRLREPGADPEPLADAQHLVWPQDSYTNRPGDEPSGILQLRVRLP